MNVRLAFSVAIQVEAEILLIDEVLAVGDASFQQKCFDEFERLKRAGRTILFVTHDMGAIERFCDRAMLLEKGAVVTIGAPADVARRYNALNFGGTVHQRADDAPRQRPRPRPDRSRSSTAGSRTATAYASPRSSTASRAAPAWRCSFNEALDDPIFGFTLRNEVGSTVFATTTDQAYGRTGRFDAGRDPRRAAATSRTTSRRAATR